MSVEPLVIAGIVEHGNPKPAFQAGVNKKDFIIYTDEFEWLERRYNLGKPISKRLFCERFPDFEYYRPKEKLTDLLDELRHEKAYEQVASLIESVSENLLPENALDNAEHMREVLTDVVKLYSPHSDISLKSKDYYETMRQQRMLAKNGHSRGMYVLIPSLDYHWDGFNPGRLIAVLGRPGEGKSFIIAWLAWVFIKTGYNGGLFSPEMNEDEHLARLHTLASADPEVQKACGLKQSFRNRDLMRGTGFNLKAYKRLLEYIDELPGNCWLFTRRYRKNPMTTPYIASRVEDLGLHGVLVDPISKISTGLRRNDNQVWDSYDKVHSFQEMLEEYNVFGVATNWSTRQQGKLKNEKAPDLDDSFGSDALAQESDHVIGVKHDPDDKTLTLRCSKSRFSKPKFSAVIDFHPNTGWWQEVNIEPEVHAYRATLNGKAPINGIGGKKPVIAAGKVKVKA